MGSEVASVDGGRLMKSHTDWRLACLMLIGGILIGQFSFWNLGLAGGFGNYLLAMLFCAAMYLCLANSMAELSSVLPFAGGTYGYVRVTMGIYMGYIIGCCELVSYMILPSVLLLYMGLNVTVIFRTSPLLEPIWWSVLTMLYLAPIMRNKYFWYLNGALGVLTIIWTLIFFFTPCVISPSYSKHARSEDIGYFEGGVGGFFFALVPSVLLYLGIEIIPLMSEDIKNPKECVPKAIMYCTYAVLGLSITVVLITCATAHIEELLEDEYVFLYGYNAIFGVSDQRYFRVVLLPPSYLMLSSFQYANSRLLFAMARSGFFPPVLGALTTSRNSPRNANLTGASLVLILSAVFWIDSSSYISIFGGGVFAAVCAYMSMFLSFIIFRLHFQGLERKYISKTGIMGALFGIFLCAVVLIAIAVTSLLSIALFAGIVSLFSVYYYFVASKRQKLSAEEKEVMLIAHVIKANRIAAAKKHHRLVQQREAEDRAVAKNYSGPAPLRHRCHVSHHTKAFVVLPEITLQPIKKPGQLDPRFLVGNTSTMIRNESSSEFYQVFGGTTAANGDISITTLNP